MKLVLRAKKPPWHKRLLGWMDWSVELDGQRILPSKLHESGHLLVAEYRIPEPKQDDPALPPQSSRVAALYRAVLAEEMPSIDALLAKHPRQEGPG